jgi:delta14-sterol reductase
MADTDTPSNLARDDFLSTGSYNGSVHGNDTSRALVKNKKAALTNAQLNPRTREYEFGGPLGAFGITLIVPFVTYALYFGCSEHAGGCPPFPPRILLFRLVEALGDREWWAGLWDTKAALIYLGWYAFCVISWAVLPGDWIEGVELRTGEKKKYKINGTPYLLSHP